MAGLVEQIGTQSHHRGDRGSLLGEGGGGAVAARFETQARLFVREPEGRRSERDVSGFSRPKTPY